MTQLSVNVNKIATLRNARGGQVPNVLQVSKDILHFGAFGITVHPRPDERHIKKQDVIDLSKMVSEYKKAKPSVELNVEGYPSTDFMDLIESTRPDQCTLVPDPPGVLTSNAGWKLNSDQIQVLKPILTRLRGLGVRSSVFVDPYDVNDHFLKTLNDIKPDRVELYTEMYASAFGTSEQDAVTEVYFRAANQIHLSGIELNAGHDLDQNNLAHFVKSVRRVKEVSIGHALVSEALYLGLEKTVQNYLECLK